MEQHKILVLIAVVFCILILLIIPNIPFTNSQFIEQSTDLNYIKFLNNDYNGLCLQVDGNKLTAGSCSGVSSTDWASITNFPLGCDVNQAVQIIGSSLTCIDINGSGATTNNYFLDNNKIGVLQNGKWCDSNGDAINCTQDAPTGSSSFDSNLVKFVYDDLNLISVEGNARKLYVDVNGFGIIESIEISTAGSGYVETDIIGINGGNGEATFIVTSVDEFGGITNISLSDRGDAYSIGNDITTNALTGKGADATVNILSLLDYLTQLDYSIPFAISGAGAASPTEGSVFMGNDAGNAATSAYYSNFFGERAGSGAEGAETSNFFGRNTGKNANNASKSNFFGNEAGVDASNASSSNFFGNYAGGGAISASGSNFFGENAGANATDATSSNFFGTSAGDGATYANSSNFFGTLAGQNAVYAASSNFFGANAGKYATSASTSNFFGLLAGYEATNAYSSNFFGTNAGEGATNASSSNFFGEGSGLNATDASGSNFFGTNAGESATDATSSNFFGANAGNNADYASGSNFFGSYAGYVATLASSSNFFGNLAGANSTYADSSNFFGLYAGNNAPNARNSIFIGNTAGYEATNAANSIFLGENSGASDTVDNTYGGKIITLNSTPIDGGSGYSVGVPYLILGGNNDAYAYGGSGSGGTLEHISLTFGGTNYEVGTYFLDGGNGDANIEVTEVSPIQGFGSSILIGNNTSTGGFRDSVSIGKGTMNDATQQMNLGNVIKINGIYKEATPSSTLMTGATVEMGDNNLNLGNITATGTICDSVGCIGTGGTGSNYTDENALALINSLDLNNTLNYLPSNTVIPVDTNWETSWATFDANMRAEYNLPATPSSGTDTNWQTNFSTFDANLRAHNYITVQQSDSNYQAKGVYVTPTTLDNNLALYWLKTNNFVTKTSLDGNLLPYITIAQADANYWAKTNNLVNKTQLDGNLLPYITIAQADANYQPKGTSFITISQADTNYWAKSTNLVNKTQLDGNLLLYYTRTQSDANWAKYQLLGSYITIPQADANYYSKSVSDTNWAKYLPLTGGKMTGDLNIGLKNAIDANSITFRNGAGKSWIDNNGTCMRLTSGTTTVFIGC